METKKIIIEQIESGRFNIHCTASTTHDRIIEVPVGGYAVVISAYYGDQYTAHDTAELAIDAAKNLKEKYGEISYVIMDDNGRQMQIEQGYYEDKLESLDDYFLGVTR